MESNAMHLDQNLAIDFNFWPHRLTFWKENTYKNDYLKVSMGVHYIRGTASIMN